MTRLLQSDFEFTAFLAEMSLWYRTSGRLHLEAEQHAPLAPIEEDWLALLAGEQQIARLTTASYGTRDLFRAVHSGYTQMAQFRAATERNAA